MGGGGDGRGAGDVMQIVGLSGAKRPRSGGEVWDRRGILQVKVLPLVRCAAHETTEDGRRLLITAHAGHIFGSPVRRREGYPIDAAQGGSG